MEKLRKAEEQIGFLQGELLRLQPELLRTSIETRYSAQFVNELLAER